MRFVDQCRVKVIAGHGGQGAVAFRREKFIPFGGPAGGDGGRGGDVIFVGDEGLSTLLDITNEKTLKAEPGKPGSGKDRHGRGGADREERVPIGTQIFDEGDREREASDDPESSAQGEPRDDVEGDGGRQSPSRVGGDPKR